jgi:hypothetical protein
LCVAIGYGAAVTKPWHATFAGTALAVECLESRLCQVLSLSDVFKLDLVRLSATLLACQLQAPRMSLLCRRELVCYGEVIRDLFLPELFILWLPVVSSSGGAFLVYLPVKTGKD